MRVLVMVMVLGTVVLAQSRKKDGGQEDFEFVEDGKEKATTVTSLEKRRTWTLDPDNALCGLLRCGKREMCLLQDRFTAVCVNKAEVTRNGDTIIPLKAAGGEHSFNRPWNDPEEYEDDDDDYDDEDDDYILDDEDDDDESEENTKPETDETTNRLLNRRPFAGQCPSCPVQRPLFLCGSDNRTYSSTCRLHYHNCIHNASVRIVCKGFCPCKGSQMSVDRSRKGRNRLLKDRRGKDQGSDRRNLRDRFAKRKGGYRGKYGSKSSYGSKYGKDIYRKNDKRYGKGRNWNNEVIHEASNNVWGPNECSQEALEAMGNRMLDWFSVIMSDARARPVASSKAPNWCKPEVAWMLAHLDNDANGQLSVKELYQLEHDDRERCIKPFIDRCDLDRDVFLSGREWCKCFDKSERPCAALRKASKDLLGGYIPECDSEGYYRSTQCHLSVGMCWCVDKHGVELPNSRTHGTPNCDSLMSNQVHDNRVDDDAEVDDEDDTVEGSADMPLDI